MSYKNSLNDTFSSRHTGKAARKNYLRKKRESDEIRENDPLGLDTVNTGGMVMPMSRGDESDATTHYDGESNAVRIRDDVTAMTLPVGNEKEWKKNKNARNIINGMHQITMVETDPNSDVMSPFQVGARVNMQSYGKGHPGKDGSTRSLRIVKDLGIVDLLMGMFDSDIGTASAFDGGSGTPMPLPKNTPEEVKKLAANYDEDDTIPNKSNHKNFLADMHQEFEPLIKAFIFKVWSEQKTSIRINSSYRSPEHQKRLRDDYDNGDAAYKATHAKPAKPPVKKDGKWSGGSFHNVGMALDFNPTLENGTGLFKRTPTDKTANQQIWLASNVPNIGQSVGLRWGGEFTTNFDPIHFDMGKGKVVATLLNEADKQGKPANRFELV